MEEPTQRTDQGLVVGLDDRWPGDDENIPARLERGRHHPECLPKPTPDPVADDRPAELAPCRESEPRRLEVCPEKPCGEEAVGLAEPGALNRREVLRTREHHETRRVGAAPVRQAVSRFRPRARRAAMTRRPPGVRMRARKPCSLARCRFLGWYVRFIGAVRDPLRWSSGRRTSPPKGTQTRLAPVKRTRAFVVRRMIGLAEEGCQTGRASSEGRPGGSLGRSNGYSLGVSQNRLAGPVPAVLSSPSPRRRDARG